MDIGQQWIYTIVCIHQYNWVHTWISCGIIVFRRKALTRSRSTACCFTSRRRFTSRSIHQLTYRFRTCTACHGTDACAVLLTGPYTKQ